MFSSASAEPTAGIALASDEDVKFVRTTPFGSMSLAT
jgi:hypothetical protein